MQILLHAQQAAQVAASSIPQHSMVSTICQVTLHSAQYQLHIISCVPDCNTASSHGAVMPSFINDVAQEARKHAICTAVQTLFPMAQASHVVIAVHV
jgi:hypothetical protein